jgi:hypothetical protein
MTKYILSKYLAKYILSSLIWDKNVAKGENKANQMRDLHLEAAGEPNVRLELVCFILGWKDIRS